MTARRGMFAYPSTDRDRGIISGFEIVLHCVILPPFPPCDFASRLYLRNVIIIILARMAVI